MMILSKPKQLEILKTILVNRILMVFQNQPMLGNGLAMTLCGTKWNKKCSVWNNKKPKLCLRTNLRKTVIKHSLSGHILAEETSNPLKPRMRHSLCYHA
jgi:hypothetical protein